jgi:tetratricopeptide (TPR) repeat protein
MDEKEKRLWAERIVKAVNKVYPYVEFENWPLCERLLLHAKRCAEYINAWKIEDAEAGGLLNQVGSYLKDQGRYAEAEPLYQRALVIREKIHVIEHPDVAVSLNNQALLYKKQGRYAEAELLYQRSLAISEKTLGKGHPDVVTCLNNLVGFYRDQGRYAEAEELLKTGSTSGYSPPA